MKYFLPDSGETTEDAQELNILYNMSPASFAEEAGCDIFNNRDGWENNWPIIIAVVLDNGLVEQFEVCLDYEPTFIAYKKE